jgi:hypothetical protein
MPSLPPIAAAAAGLPRLMAFRDLMAAHGHPVQVTRMCFDRLYAFERIALAHAGSDAVLRALALELFQACQEPQPALAS